jgi:hypothetical protein
VREHTLVFAAKLLGNIIETTIEYKSDDGKISKFEKIGYGQFLDDIIRFIIARKEIIEDAKNFNPEVAEAIRKAFCESIELDDEILEAKFEIGMDLLIKAAQLADEVSDFIAALKED